MAEFDGGRISAVLAADAQFKIRTGAAALFRRHADELSHAVLIQLGERIGFINLALIVVNQELARIVTGEAVGHLGQVIGSEGEELRFFSDLIGQKSRARNLDHGPDMVGDIGISLRLHLLCGFHYHVLDELQLLFISDERNHDLGNNVEALLFLHLNGCLNDRSGLHPCDLRVGDGQAAASVAHHRVKLMQAVTGSLHFRNAQIHLNGQLFNILFFRGHEFMERRIQETDGNRVLSHHLINRLEIAFLERNQLVQSSFSGFRSGGKDHLTDLRNSFRRKEHVLGTAQPDAFRSKSQSICRILRRIRVGANLKLPEGIRPLHNPFEIAADRGILGSDISIINLSGGAVQRDVITFMIGFSAKSEEFCLFINYNVAAAGNAGGSHTSRHNSRVGGHAAAYGQNAFCRMHAFDILRRGLQSDQNDSFSTFMCFLGVIRSEINLSCRSAGGCGQSLSNHKAVLQGFGIKGRMKELVERLCLNTAHRLFRRNHAFVNQIAGDLQGCGSCPLSVSGLQEVELSFFDGEFHILHVAVMLLKTGCDLDELFIAFRKILFQTSDRLRGPDSGNHVFTLGVDQIFSINSLCACGRISCKCHAGSGGISHVSEYHGLHVDSGSPVTGNVVHSAVDDGTLVIPGTEYGLDSLHELHPGILGEILSHPVLINRLEAGDNLLQIVRRQICIKACALGFLNLIKHPFKKGFGDFHYHIRKHLDKSAVGIIGKSGISSLFGKTFHGNIGKTQIQDRIHHAGHGCSGTGTNRNEKRIFRVAEGLSLLLFQFGKRVKDLALNFIRNLPSIVVVIRAGFCGHGKALRNGKAQVGHLCQIGAFPAKKGPHVSVSFLK